MKNPFAQALKEVINARLLASHVGLIWRDDHTWESLADELVAKLFRSYALIERNAYNQLLRDSREITELRRRMAEYDKLAPKKKTADYSGMYAQWAKENMP